MACRRSGVTSGPRLYRMQSGGVSLSRSGNHSYPETARTKALGGEGQMSRFGRTVGLLAALLMFCFSAWMYTRTGDWVAALFALGSVAYGFFFYTTTAGRGP